MDRICVRRVIPVCRLSSTAESHFDWSGQITVRSSADTWPGPREKLFSCTPWHHRYNRTRLRIDREWSAHAAARGHVKTDEETCAKTLTHFFTTDWRVAEKCVNFCFLILESAGVNRVRRESYAVALITLGLMTKMGTHIPDGRRKKKKTKKLKIIKMFPDQLMEETELTAGGADRVESGSNVSPREEKKKKQEKKILFPPSSSTGVSLSSISVWRLSHYRKAFHFFSFYLISFSPPKGDCL